MQLSIVILSIAAAVQCAPNPEPRTRHVIGGAAIGLGAATLWNQHNQIEDLKAQQAHPSAGGEQVVTAALPSQGQIPQCVAPVVIVNGVPMQAQMVNGVPTVHFQA